MLKLKELRQERKLNQQDLAKKIGVSRSTIAMWETGGSQPDSNMLEKLAQFFDVSVDYILGNVIEPKELQHARTTAKKLYEVNQDWPYKDIETKTGTNIQTFKCWLNGIGDYFNDKLSVLADLFGVTVDFLLGREERTLDEQLEGVEFALFGEIHDLTDEEKQDILSYVKFKKSQRGDNN